MHVCPSIDRHVLLTARFFPLLSALEHMYLDSKEISLCRNMAVHVVVILLVDYLTESW